MYLLKANPGELSSAEPTATEGPGIAGTVSVSEVPFATLMDLPAPTPESRNLAFMRECTGKHGIVYQGGPKRYPNGTFFNAGEAHELREHAHHLCGRLLFHYDHAAHRVHGNGPDRPHMWYCQHAEGGEGRQTVARVTPAAQEASFMKAHDAIVRFSMPAALKRFIDSGEAEVFQSGFLVENVRLKVLRTEVTSFSGRNPEGSKRYRMYSGESRAVPDRSAMTAEDRLYRDSSGHPLYSWQLPTLVSEHQGALGYVHVDSQGSYAEAFINVIVIISENGGASVFYHGTLCCDVLTYVWRCPMLFRPIV